MYFRKGWGHTWTSPLLNENLSAEVEVYRGGRHYSYEQPLPGECWSWAYPDLSALCPDLLSSSEDVWTNIRLMEEISRLHLA